jgi:hypothetical protein
MTGETVPCGTSLGVPDLAIPRVAGMMNQEGIQSGVPLSTPIPLVPAFLTILLPGRPEDLTLPAMDCDTECILAVR